MAEVRYATSLLAEVDLVLSDRFRDGDSTAAS